MNKCNIWPAVASTNDSDNNSMKVSRTTLNPAAAHKKKKKKGKEKHSSSRSKWRIQRYTFYETQYDVLRWITFLNMTVNSTVKTLYTDIRYNDKIRYNDNLNETIP